MSFRMRINMAGARRWFASLTLLLAGAGIAISTLRAAERPARTTVHATAEDFFQPGTQPRTLLQPLLPPSICIDCHETGAEDANDFEMTGIYDNWVLSMEAQSSRDPVFRAALAIATQDVANAADFCTRCHTPFAWLNGHSAGPDAMLLMKTEHDEGDDDGVACIVCHRMVDPVYNPDNPLQDSPVALELLQKGLLPKDLGNATYVIDPYDSRRGPLDDIPLNMHGVPIVVSPFHGSDASRLCGTCHDVGNPAFSRRSDGTYELNAAGAPHPTHLLRDMPPLHRTYSEWLHSDFARKGVWFNDQRFGGEHLKGFVQGCTDCHMVRHDGGVCALWIYEPFKAREAAVGDHSLIGANTWVLNAIHDVYREHRSGLTLHGLDLKSARTRIMLQHASDMTLQRKGDQLHVRITNLSGHKLPTGFPDGQRMWLNVKFIDCNDEIIAERGAYDFQIATLNAADTKVYEVRLGISSATGRAAGLPPGASFHYMLNSEVVKDNRIPPMGFRNAEFAAVQAAPVDCRYEDGQHWDDTTFDIPPNAGSAVVTLYYQTTSREYIEFLRDANVTDDTGREVHDLWVNHGQSAPVEMDVQFIDLAGGG